MTSVSIHMHAGGPPDFETTDDITIAAVRASLDGPPADRWLVPAHELAAPLRRCGRPLWAAVLDAEEEAHVVTVVFSGHHL